MCITIMDFFEFPAKFAELRARLDFLLRQFLSRSSSPGPTRDLDQLVYVLSWLKHCSTRDDIMATSPGTDAASSLPYHEYPAAPVLSPSHGPPAYPGDATEVSAVEVQVELPSADRDEEELGTNGEVSKDFVC